MTKQELISKLGDIEWEDFEVKEAGKDLPKNIWETVSAFSNTGGGWVILGVKQNGKNFDITGLKNAEKTAQDFTTVLRGEKFNVKINPLSKKYKFAEGTVLGFYIPLSNKKPVYFNTPANTFIRTANGDQRATKEEFDSMMRDQAFGTQTSKTIVGSSSKQLHRNSVKQYREYLLRNNPAHPYNRLTNDEFLQKLQIVVKNKLTYSGLLFLGENDHIQHVFPDFRIDLLEIPGTSYSDSSARYTFRIEEHENLWSYYFGLMDRLRRSVDLPFQISADGFSKEDHPQLEALREALVNMLMHTDYFSTARPRIRIFENRIEFFNPGALPEPLENIMQGDITMPRNPLLAKMFRAARLAENAGFGFDKMKRGWKPYSGSVPEFEQGLDFTKAVFILPAKDDDGKKGGRKSGQKGGLMGGAIGSPIGGAKDDLTGGLIGSPIGGLIGGPIELTTRQCEILGLINKNSKITKVDISEHLNINVSAVLKHLSTLKQKGVLERIGGTRGYWKILIKPEDFNTSP